jgi:hypothetical protein
VESPRFGTHASADMFIAVARDKFASNQRAAEDAKIAAKKAAEGRRAEVRRGQTSSGGVGSQAAR